MFKPIHVHVHNTVPLNCIIMHWLKSEKTNRVEKLLIAKHYRSRLSKHNFTMTFTMFILYLSWVCPNIYLSQRDKDSVQRLKLWPSSSASGGENICSLSVEHSSRHNHMALVPIPGQCFHGNLKNIAPHKIALQEHSNSYMYMYSLIWENKMTDMQGMVVTDTWQHGSFTHPIQFNIFKRGGVLHKNGCIFLL